MPSDALSRRVAPSPSIRTSEEVADSSSVNFSSRRKVMSGVATLASTSSRAARARARCSAIALSKPAISMVRPASPAISSVSSQGNPYVSYNLNTSAPGTSVALASFNSLIKAPSISRPCAKVWLKRSSSLATTRLMKSCFSIRPGTPEPKMSITTSTKSVKKRPSIPSKRP